MTRFKRVYFIDVEVYQNNLYFIKFFLRADKDKKDRFRKMTHDNDAWRILSTCLAVMKEVSTLNPLASFGFIGMPQIHEKENSTKRYKVYQQIAITNFPPSKYEHQRDEKMSLYFLLQKENKLLDINNLVKEMENTYQSL
ncbi:hypothetical protein [Spongiimicrobium salis]|uniref:hypothetical protein n=1 Tax=Spongiimicrobium salis TaxID=1667022 RepID=UPI00374DD537